MRIGLNGYLPAVYSGPYSTGKRICKDFVECLNKTESVKTKILAEAERCRDQFTESMLHRGYFANFEDSHKLTMIIGDSLQEKVCYERYQQSDESDKQRIANIIANILAISEADNLQVSSDAHYVGSLNSDGTYPIHKPSVHIHLGEALTKEKLNQLLDDELDKPDSELAQFSIFHPPVFSEKLPLKS
jgi:hypothetical protein